MYAMGDRIFGHVEVSGEAFCNIISLGKVLDDGKRVEYDRRREIFVAKLKHGLGKVIFKKGIENIYTSNLEPKYCGMTKAIMYLGTKRQIIEENGYKNRDVKRAEQPREISKRFCFPTELTLVKIINSGGIIYSEISEKDVKRATVICGKDKSEQKGKTTGQNIAIVSHIPNL